MNQKIAIFCDGEFWHGYNWEERKNELKVNQTFWFGKIERNIEKDKQINAKLKTKGWLVLRFWGNEIKKHLDECINVIEQTFHNTKE